MNSIPNRRRNSFEHLRRPASLRTFWNAVFRVWWDFQDRMARWQDFVVLVLTGVVGIAFIAAAAFLVALVFWG